VLAHAAREKLKVKYLSCQSKCCVHRLDSLARRHFSADISLPHSDRSSIIRCIFTVVQFYGAICIHACEARWNELLAQMPPIASAVGSSGVSVGVSEPRIRNRRAETLSILVVFPTRISTCDTMHRALLALVLVCACASVSAFYLPGVVPQQFQEGQPVTLKVNKLDSIKTQLPFDYYSLNFCPPDKLKPENENLGEILSGDVIENSVYEVRLTRKTSRRLAIAWQ